MWLTIWRFQVRFLGQVKKSYKAFLLWRAHKLWSNRLAVPSDCVSVRTESALMFAHTIVRCNVPRVVGWCLLRLAADIPHNYIRFINPLYRYRTNDHGWRTMTFSGWKSSKHFLISGRDILLASTARPTSTIYEVSA